MFDLTKQADQFCIEFHNSSEVFSMFFNNNFQLRFQLFMYCDLENLKRY